MYKLYREDYDMLSRPNKKVVVDVLRGEEGDYTSLSIGLYKIEVRDHLLIS